MKQIMKKINFSRPLKCIHGILLIMYRNYTWKFNSDTKHSIDWLKIFFHTNYFRMVGLMGL